MKELPKLLIFDSSEHEMLEFCKLVISRNELCCSEPASLLLATSLGKYTACSNFELRSESPNCRFIASPISAHVRRVLLEQQQKALLADECAKVCDIDESFHCY